jgi:histidinol-phosphatase (PHP family)
MSGLSSLHTHTLFCDGADTVETMCQSAYEKKLTAIGFSSHAPIAEKTGFKTAWHLKEARFEAYLAEIEAARIRWEGKLTVFAGLEVDYIDGLLGPADFKDSRLDYLIGSVHYLLPPHGEPFTVDGPLEEFERGLREGFAGDIGALVDAYWDAEENLVKNGGFTILGHLDLIKKNNSGERFFSSSAEAYTKRLTALAASVAKSGTVVEVNTGGVNRGKTTETYPSPFFLRLLKESEVPVIITSDAHCAEHIDGHYQMALDAVAQAGYKNTVLFAGKKDGVAMWSQSRAFLGRG